MEKVIESHCKSYFMLSLQCPPRQVKRLLDKNLTFHKAIAWMIVVSSAVHIIAHWYNYERLVGLALGSSLNSKWPWEPRYVPQDAQPALPSGVTLVCLGGWGGVGGEGSEHFMWF